MVLVAARREGLSAEAGDLFTAGRVEACRAVESGADRGTADGELPEMIGRLENLRSRRLEHAAPAGDFLTEADRNGILQMRAADLQHIMVLLLETLHRRDQRVDCRDELRVNREHCGHVHRRREGVVRGLGHIDMIVRVDIQLRMIMHRDMCDHLVHIHVGLRAGAGLPYLQRELLRVFAVADIVAGIGDCLCLRLRKFAEGVVRGRRRGLQHRKGVNHLARDRLRADAEILQRTLGLRAPEMLCRHTDLTHSVMFDTIFHVLSSLFMKRGITKVRFMFFISARYADA